MVKLNGWVVAVARGSLLRNFQGESMGADRVLDFGRCLKFCNFGLKKCRFVPLFYAIIKFDRKVLRLYGFDYGAKNCGRCLHDALIELLHFFYL